MFIDKITLQKWNKLKEWKDGQKLVKLTGKSAAIISKALKGKYCSLELYKTLSDFFSKREKEIKKIKV